MKVDYCGIFMAKDFKIISKTSAEYFLLFAYALILYAATTCAIPTPESGKKLILHTQEHKDHYHRQLIQQERLKPPPPVRKHHHLHLRSVDNSQLQATKMNTQNLLDYLKNAQKQANNSFASVKSGLPNFIKNQFNNRSVEDVITDYDKHNVNWDHSLKGKLQHDFMKEADDELFEYLENASDEILMEELGKVYVLVQMFNKTFESIQDLREEYKNQVKHDLQDKIEPYYEIETFLDSVKKHLRQDLDHIINVTRTMNINLENLTVNVPNAMDIYNTQQNLWLLIREHLSFMQYLRKLYGVLVRIYESRI